MVLRYLRPVFLVLALLAPPLSGGSADARSLTGEEATSLNEAAASYLRAVANGDAENIVTALPPRLLTVFGAAAGIESRDLTKTLVEQTAVLLKQTSFSNVAASDDVPLAGDAKLSDGTDVTWAIVKTSFISTTAGKSTQNWQPLLALLEVGKWYFLRVEGPQSKQLAAIAYPFLNDIDFPPASSAPAN